ncbi:MAG: hypothetical protein K0Q85_452 [Caproiciproducens sp.]|jgi:hypothetical protein|nr:hypothetical protein [Caproiciproducens sp.]
MKKSGSVLLTVLMIFSLSACSGKQSAGSTVPPADSGTSVSSQESAVSQLSQPESKNTSSAVSSLSPDKNQQGAAKSTAEKSKSSSQLEDVYSTIENLKGVTGGLDDVVSEDMGVPNP